MTAAMPDGGHRALLAATRPHGATRDVAAAALFLLRDEAGFIAGAESCDVGGMRQV